MKIYTLKPNNNKAEVFNLECPLDMFDGISLVAQWIPPRISRFNVGKMFYDLMTCDTPSLIITNENAHHSLQALMLEDAEFLQTTPSNELSESYYIFNVVKVIHRALDTSKSKISYFPSGRILRIYNYVFNDDAKKIINDEVLVFKIDDIDISPIFVTEKFIDMLKQLHLTRSFDFKEIAEI